jgi:hypothetical protein
MTADEIIAKVADVHPRTVRDVNKLLKNLGITEQLVRGKGYYYFGGGEAHTWYSSSVPVAHITQLTMRQWLDYYYDLKAKRGVNRS